MLVYWRGSDRSMKLETPPSWMSDMPTRTVKRGKRLNASSLASEWSNARLVGLSVFDVVHRELSYT
jgi:hypothetical protein